MAALLGTAALGTIGCDLRASGLAVMPGPAEKNGGDQRDDINRLPEPQPVTGDRTNATDAAANALTNAIEVDTGAGAEESPALVGPEPHGDASLQAAAIDAVALADTDPMIADDGLVGYFRFDDAIGSTVALDDSGFDQAAQLRNVEAASAWVDGKIGQSLALKGGANGGWAEISPSPGFDRISSAISAAAWIYRTDTGAGNSTIVARASRTPDVMLYRFQVVATRVRVSFDTGGPGAIQLTSEVSLPRLHWVHVAMTAGDGYLRIYVNGILTDEKPYLLSLAPSDAPVLLGASQTGPAVPSIAHLVGRLDELVVYDRVLTAAEIQWLANGVSPRPN